VNSRQKGEHKMSEQKGLSRRDFVKVTAAGVGAAALLNGFNPKDVMAKLPKKWDAEADVVIVGAGGAGLAAAVQITAKGKSVILLEKMPTYGGSSLICGGALAFAGTDLQASENVKDSNDLFYKDLMKVGENANVPALVKAYVDNQLETYEWLKKAGVKFLKLGIASGMSVPRSHNVIPADLLKTLNGAAKAQGVKLMMETAASRLVVDEKTGNVRGVQAARKGQTVFYGAKKGVILTSGGFSLDKGMLAKFVPPMAFSKAMVGRGSNGDGLKMAWALGADIKDMPYIKATFGFDLEAQTIKDDFALMFYQGAIIINKEGKRFVNESISYKLVGDAALVQKDAMGYQIYDAAIRTAGEKDPFGRTASLEGKGRIQSAATLKELAQKIGVSADALEATVREYNAGVDKGTDALGRKTLVAAFGKPVKIEQAPFYAFPSTAYILGTYGGILTNEKAQVVDVFGQPIPGLYAAGEIVGGVHGAAYMTGTAFGKALIFGRIAANNILV
jgi:fumarate reductase flavoprotein subunit